MPKFITIGETRYNIDEIVKYRPLDANTTGVTMRTSGQELIYPEPIDKLDKIIRDSEKSVPDESTLRQLIRSMDNLSGHILRMPSSMKVKF